jgi:DNA-binding transcriptional LysR family regulator
MCATVDLNTLELFIAVAESSSFSLAAKKLGLPKSTVSRGLARLENDLGVRLINRTTRQVSLSSAGVALLERVGPQLSALKRAVGELPEAEEQPSGHLRITAAVDFGAVVLPELVTQFVARCPSVSVEVNVSNRLVDLVGERYDLAFRAVPGRLKDSSLLARKVGTIRTQLFASPTYLARKGTPRTPRELLGHDWAVFRKPGPLMLEGPGETASVEMQGRLVADDLFFLREAVRAGAGIGALPSFLGERDVGTGALSRVLPRWDSFTGTMWVVSPGSHLPKKTVAFRDFAIEHLRAHPLSPFVA